jgi:hypothetical protein
MSFLTTQVRRVQVVAVTIGMTACAPRFVSLPSNLRADAQQTEYRTSTFTVRAPHGRWVAESVVSVRHLKVPRSECETPYNSLALDRVVYPAVTSNVVEQVRFYRVVRMQIITDDPKLLNDADACIAVTSYPLILHDSSAVAPENPLGLFQTVQQNVRNLAASICVWRGFWGVHVTDGVGRFQELRVGERKFYYVAFVSEKDSTKFCEDHGVELLYAAQGKVFAVYASSPGILDDALPVAESLTPH